MRFGVSWIIYGVYKSKKQPVEAKRNAVTRKPEKASQPPPPPPKEKKKTIETDERGRKFE